MTAAAPAAADARRLGAWAATLRSPAVVLGTLMAALIVVAIVASTIGAAGIPLHRLMAAFGLSAGDGDLIARDRLVLWSIRLPRIALASIIASSAILKPRGTLRPQVAVDTSEF